MRGNGSAGSDETGAQKFHSEVQRLIGQHLQATKGSPCVLELGADQGLRLGRMKHFHFQSQAYMTKGNLSLNFSGP